ncbi:MAG: hypothetical protein LC620_08155, partial [Halobacteriales archaeon]|nr:hypothetical protein [Halobacteriales archaeon]
MLKTQLFDIDLRLKETVRRTAVTAVFPFVFLLSARGISFFVQGPWDAVVAASVASALLLALSPIRRTAGRLADALFPNIQAS